MSADGPEMDEWAALWAEQPSRAEQQNVRAAAGRVTTRAMCLRYANLAVAVLLAAGVLLALIIRPAPATLAMGLLAAVGLLAYSWKHHVLTKQLLALLQVSQRSDLLDLETRRVKTALRRATLGLWATPPAIILFAAFTYGFTNGGNFHGFAENLLRSAMQFPVGPAIVAAMITLAFQQLQIVRRLTGELQRLQSLGRVYENEAALDRASLG